MTRGSCSNMVALYEHASQTDHRRSTTDIMYAHKLAGLTLREGSRAYILRSMLARDYHSLPWIVAIRNQHEFRNCCLARAALKRRTSWSLQKRDVKNARGSIKALIEQTEYVAHPA